MKTKDLLAACFLVFGTLLVWPMLSIANLQSLFLGVPSLVLYLFLVWAAIVGVLAWVASRAGGDDP